MNTSQVIKTEPKSQNYPFRTAPLARRKLKLFLSNLFFSLKRPFLRTFGFLDISVDNLGAQRICIAEAI